MVHNITRSLLTMPLPLVTKRLVVWGQLEKLHAQSGCHGLWMSGTQQTMSCTWAYLSLFVIAAEKLEQAEGQLSHAGRTGQFGGMDRKPAASDSQLLKICRDSSKMSVEQIKGITAQVSQPCCVLYHMAFTSH